MNPPRLAVITLTALIVACNAPLPPEAARPLQTTTVARDTTTTSTEPSTTTAASPTTTRPRPTTTTTSEFAAPDWLGTRVLEIGPNGYGLPQPTPPELVDRRIATEDRLDPPKDDRFIGTVEAVPSGVARRSTWREGCPVPLDGLRYLTISFWGFDERFHTGELIVHESAADGMVEVFRTLHEIRFPIEEMRIASLRDLDRPRTGDNNETSSFECRAATGSTGWSMHAYGLAIDVNTFHNPYVKGELVLPELASAYLDREDVRPGMILAGDEVVDAFAAMGWEWGGEWNTLKDYMHFSSNGR